MIELLWAVLGVATGIVLWRFLMHDLKEHRSSALEPRIAALEKLVDVLPATLDELRVADGVVRERVNKLEVATTMRQRLQG